MFISLKEQGTHEHKNSMVLACVFVPLRPFGQKGRGKKKKRANNSGFILVVSRMRNHHLFIKWIIGEIYLDGFLKGIKIH